MHKEDRKSEIRKRFKTLGAFAKSIKVSSPTLSQVLAGGKSSKRVQTAVANALNLPFHEVWPQDKLATTIKQPRKASKKISLKGAARS